VTSAATSAPARRTLDLDGEWRFVADPERRRSPADLPAGEAIQVPGCWEAQVQRPYRIVTAWYHRDVDIPEDWASGCVQLRFGAVMYRCQVFLDGERVGGYEGGYTPFSVDLTPRIRPGQRQRIAVQVVNPLNAIEDYPAFSIEQLRTAEEFEPDLPLSAAPHGKQTWYSSHSGLWKSVLLEHTHDVALGPLWLRPDVPGSAVEVAWALETGDPRGRQLALEVVVEGPSGREVARERGSLRGGQRSGRLRVAIPDAELWDLDHPVRYRVAASLVEAGRVVDEVADRFGMREIRTEGGRILLNGRPIYLLGSLDQDVYPDTISTPPSRAYLDDQFRLARELGLNLLRCHIKVPDPAYLEAADDAGILLWCEVPNWSTFSSVAAGRGRETLRRMVETMGNHPSVVIWTLINEDWGTQVRYERRDRRWLRETYDWLKAFDPGRLVVDNSACETSSLPNFHLRTDLADFHLYFLSPDSAPRWRGSIEDFAHRPAWLWSPHGDAESRGDEPLVLSEFGSWGLPCIEPLLQDREREPWWFQTGSRYYRPTGIARRFATFGLDRVWPSLDDLATATQWHQFEGLQYEIGELRRHGSIQGYVITEFTDAYWEANGLLDVERGPKAYHARMHELNAPDLAFADLPRRDVWAGEVLETDVVVSAYGDDPPARGRVEWRLETDGAEAAEGVIEVDPWPAADARVVGRARLAIPETEVTADARLVLRLLGDGGAERGRDERRLAVLPTAARTTTRPLDIQVHDPLGIFAVGDRIRSLGHRVVAPDQAELVVATELTRDLLARVEGDGVRGLVLVRTRDALVDATDVARRVGVVLRKHPDAGAPGQRSPWEGDWVSSFSWILPDVFPMLPKRAPLDFAYREVLSDHVLTGYDPVRHRDEVTAGMFVGWVHSPAALVWTFRQGRGVVTLTTLHVAPEDGPVATALLEGLLQHAAAADRRAPDRRADAAVTQLA
jgi:hypothetical protein